MKIVSLKLLDYSPIKHLHLEDLGSTVIIAGANGSGKTRLKEAIVATIQGQPLMDMTIESTRPEEENEKYFGSTRLELNVGVRNDTLNNYINSRKYGSGRYVGSLVQIDSNRSAQALKYNPVNWLGGDPDDTQSPGTFYFSPFTNRWQDFVNYIHQKAAARDKKLAEALKANPDQTGKEILAKNPDPFEKYRKIFSDIVPDKTLLDIDPASPREFRYRDSTRQELNFGTLSSGEQEVIKVLFDVARKEIRHSIIIVDEPDLHLHPTLAIKLVEALKNIGDHTNQFIFLTHSSDLISTYYSTGDVYFIDPQPTGSNQAHRLSDLNTDHKDIIPLIGQNLGLFAVEKKLVFVEGEESSIDRLAYQKIAQVVDSDIRVIPAGSVYNIMTLNSIEQQLRKAIFGIDLYMIRDRDGLRDSQISELEKNGRIRCLKRRQIENYFLDEDVLFEVAQRLYLTKVNPSLSAESIRDRIKEIAEGSLGYNVCQNTKDYLTFNHFLRSPTVKSVNDKDLDSIKEELIVAVSASVNELSSSLTPQLVERFVEKEELRLRAKLANGNWATEFQGKYIFVRLCADVLKEDQLRIRHAYVDVALADKPEVLQELMELFRDM